MSRVSFTICLLLLSNSAFAQAVEESAQHETVVSENTVQESSPDLDQIRQAAVRGLQFVEAKAVVWIETKKCVACHHGPFLLWTQDEAKQAGIAIDEGKLNDWTQWALKHSSPQDMEKACKDDLDSNHQMRLSRSSDLLDQQTEEAFQDISRHLLKRQESDGSWRPGNRFRTQQRRPEKESQEVTTMWSVLSLGTVGSEIEGVAESREKALAWLKQSSPGKSNESLVLNLLVEHEFGEEARQQELLKLLLDHQNQDGGWGWIHGESSDALATGLSLYALSLVETPDDRAARRAISFLVSTQQQDGSWVVPTTLTVSKRPKCGVPNYWGTAWATIGLLRTLPRPVDEKQIQRD